MEEHEAPRSLPSDAGALDYARFVEQARGALASLQDTPSLQTHPLRALLSSGEPLAVEELQRILLDALRQLRPVGPEHGMRWCIYRCLWLRYVEGVPPADIASAMGVTDRQARRYHHSGLDAVGHLLWTRHRDTHWARGRTVDAGAADGDAEAALAAEISKLGGEVPHDPVSLVDTLAEVLETTAELLRQRGVALKLAIPADLPHVASGRVFLRQALMSLLAHLMTCPRGSRVEIAGSAWSDRVILRTTVVAGSAPEDVSGDRPGPHAPAEDPLAVARRFVEVQGGRIETRSEGRLREGIEVQLPAAQRCTVLVIDDNADFLTLFRRCLDGSGYRVLQARLADEALRLARDEQPDVVVVDVLMPTQDGWELLQALRRDPLTQGVPVVVCSVIREPTLALGLGADSFLPKPITPLTLLTTLERVRSSRGTRRAPPEPAPSPRQR